MRGELPSEHLIPPARVGLQSFPRCPTASLSPEEVARSVVEAFPFPAPKPYIAPGRAITGLRAYLEPRSPTAVSDVRPTPLGDIRLDATGSYYVDWGDARTGPHSGPGGPWPNGNISHVYTNRGTYDVLVTEAWTVHWQVAGASGTLNVTTDGGLEASLWNSCRPCATGRTQSRIPKKEEVSRPGRTPRAWRRRTAGRSGRMRPPPVHRRWVRSGPWRQSRP